MASGQTPAAVGGNECERRRRQNLLGLESPDGRLLELDEILTYEHLATVHPERPLAQQIKLLPLGEVTEKGRLPSHDFAWLDRGGLSVDAKRVRRADYGVVRGRIRPSINDAWDNHEFTKDVFLIDIGGRELRDKLRRELSLYNQRTLGRKVRRLFILWRGQIDEIDFV